MGRITLSSTIKKSKKNLRRNVKPGITKAKKLAGRARKLRRKGQLKLMDGLTI